MRIPSKKTKPHQLRNEAHLNCVSLRSQLDYEGTRIAVKGQDERSLTGTPLTALHAPPGGKVTARQRGVLDVQKKTESPPRRA